jgi:hypothetical protein
MPSFVGMTGIAAGESPIAAPGIMRNRMLDAACHPLALPHVASPLLKG